MAVSAPLHAVSAMPPSVEEHASGQGRQQQDRRDGRQGKEPQNPFSTHFFISFVYWPPAGGGPLDRTDREMDETMPYEVKSLMFIDAHTHLDKGDDPCQGYDGT